MSPSDGGGEATLLARREIYQGRVITVEWVRVREPGGMETEREIVRHRGAAVLIPRLDDGRVILVRQFRYATGAYLWELPAGTLEPGELPEDGARRELVEETGFYPRRLKKLSEFYSAPGFCDELMHLFLATELEERQASPDHDEAIEVGVFTPGEAFEKMTRGEVKDAKTLLGLFHLKTLTP